MIKCVECIKREWSLASYSSAKLDSPLMIVASAHTVHPSVSFLSSFLNFFPFRNAHQNHQHMSTNQKQHSYHHQPNFIKTSVHNGSIK